MPGLIARIPAPARSLAFALALAVPVATTMAGCRGARPDPVIPTPELELALDEGRAAEQPLTPQRTFEVLIRVAPNLSVYRLKRMRLQLAQPGHVIFAFYASDGYGRPAQEIGSLDRYYGPEMTSNGTDGKWILEALDELPVQRGPVFIGLSCPEKQSDPRLWASSNDSGEVFQRDADPSVPLEQLRIRRTPRIRVTVVPE